MPLLRPHLPKVVDGDRQGRRPLPLAALEFESPSAAIIATPVPALSSATNLFVFLLVISMLVASGLVHRVSLASEASSAMELTVAGGGVLTG